jgi:hypothetical protein
MPKSNRWICSALLAVVMLVPILAAAKDGSDAKTPADTTANLAAQPSPAAAAPTLTPPVGNANVTALLGVLVMKGVLAPGEANAIRNAAPEAEMQLLLDVLARKGVVDASDLAAARAANPAPAPALPGVSAEPQGTTKPAEAPIIPAVAPLRVLPIDVPKQDGMIPDLKLGSGAKLKVYGFYKASAVSDTASSGGPTFGSQDWPLPLLLADTGPTSDPQFHIKARSFRIGGQTEWVPKNSGFTITARVEGDFEGDYTDVNNRNISAARSNQFSLRLAWMRLDHKIGDLPWFAEFGQDWSILGSSTLPNLFETTGLGVGMGSLYERIPQFRTGIQFHAGDFKVQPEFAIVMPIAGSSALTTDQRLRFGDRAGAESNQPGVEGRVVFQFPLNKSWKGVAPAQLIFSGHHARMNEIIPHAAQAATSYTFTCATTPCTVTVPTPLTGLTAPNIGFTTTTSIVGASNCAEASGTCNLEQIFAKGTQVGNPQNIYSAEVQLPTPWVTFVAKFYRGNDMRFFFAGQLNDVYSNLNGLFEVGNGVSYSGRAILFGCSGGVKDPVLANTVDCPGTAVQSAILQPIGGSGGFMEMSFPLSRIFHANPEGANSGWIFHLQYGTDRANYADAQHGNHLGRTDLDTASLTYRLNKWVTFVHEVSYINTFTANNHEAGGVIAIEKLPFAGGTTRQAHNWRNEFGPIFTF